jgi:hypothetical protein
MSNWPDWVSAKLPHVIGADPDDGKGICCLVMVAKVRRTAGLLTPELDPQWFELAAAGHWDVLKSEWDRMMVPCRLEPYALVLHRQPLAFGIGVVVDDGLLVVHHRRGAQWLPMDVASRLMPLKYWRPRDAAI